MPHGGVGELDEVDSCGARLGQSLIAGPPARLAGARSSPRRQSWNNQGILSGIGPVRSAMASRRTGPARLCRTDQGSIRSTAFVKPAQSFEGGLQVACRVWLPLALVPGGGAGTIEGRAASFAPVAQQECDKCMWEAVPWGDRLTISVAPLTYLKT